MDQVPHIIFLVIIAHMMTSARAEEDITLSCPAHQPCRTAFASYNPITLKCEGRPENASVNWQYLDVFEPHAQAVTFMLSNGSVPRNIDLISREELKALDLMSRSKLVSGDLKILSPRVQDTGVYTCKDGEKYLAYYEIDFQDAEYIHVSHASLGQSVQPKTTIDLGEEATVEMFTVWADWQPCDRCGTLGERKKVGFCYAKITRDSGVSEGPQPCGLLRSTFRKIPLNHRPELRIETCRGACNAIPSVEKEVPTMVLDTYRTYLHADALLKCPSSSIYRPVYWEHGNKSLTRLQQLTKKISYVLDKTTGGGTLYIPILNKSDQGIYKCYVDRNLVGRFQVIFPDTRYTDLPRPYSMAESMVIGISMLLVFLLLLSIAQACRKTTGRVIH